MGKIVFAGVMPHPPIVIPEVGKGEEDKVQKTVEGMKKIARAMNTTQPDVLVVITPHGPVFRDTLVINEKQELVGDLGMFGAQKVRFRFTNDLLLVREVKKQAQAENIPLISVGNSKIAIPGVSDKLDHGVMVPLYYLREGGWEGKLVQITIGLLKREELYNFGKALSKAIAECSGKKAAVIASGDLSHRLHPGAPAGYDPLGEKFDAEIREKLSSFDTKGILSISEELAERAGECGLRPIIILLGALHGIRVNPVINSYEGTFGVGYLVCELWPEAEEGNGVDESAGNKLGPVDLARASLEHFINSGSYMQPPQELTPELSKKAGAFVSLKKHGKLRGCIGTICPTRDNLALEIIYNAVEAGTRDPRFPPVQKEELDELDFSVDVLEPSEPVDSIEDLDPKKYGVIVRKGNRTGLLLPDLEGVNTAEEQLAIARQKAGIMPWENGIIIERFKVTRYK